MDSSDSDYDYSLCDQDDRERRRRRSKRKLDPIGVRVTLTPEPAARREKRAATLTLPMTSSKEMLTRKQEWLERLCSNLPKDHLRPRKPSEDGDYMFMRPQTAMQMTVNADDDYMEMNPSTLYVVKQMQLGGEMPASGRTTPARYASVPNGVFLPSSPGLINLPSGLSRSQPNLGRVISIERETFSHTRSVTEGDYMEMQPSFGRGNKAQHAIPGGSRTLPRLSKTAILNLPDGNSNQGVGPDSYESESPYMNMATFRHSGSSEEHHYADLHELFPVTKAYTSGSSCSSISSDDDNTRDRDLEVHSEPESSRHRVGSNPPIAYSRMRRKASDSALNRLAVSTPPPLTPPKALKLLVGEGNEDEFLHSSGQRSQSMRIYVERNSSFRQRVAVAVKRLARPSNSPTNLTPGENILDKSTRRRHTTSDAYTHRTKLTDEALLDLARRHSSVDGQAKNKLKNNFSDLTPGKGTRGSVVNSSPRTGETPREGSEPPLSTSPFPSSGPPRKPRPYKEYLGHKETLKVLSKTTLV